MSGRANGEDHEPAPAAKHAARARCSDSAFIRSSSIRQMSAGLRSAKRSPPRSVAPGAPGHIAGYLRQPSTHRFMHATQHRPNASSSMRAPLCVGKSIRPSAGSPCRQGKTPGSLTGKDLPVRLPADIPVGGKRVYLVLTISMASAGSAWRVRPSRRFLVEGTSLICALRGAPPS